MSGLAWNVQQGTLDLSAITSNVVLGSLTGTGTVTTGSHALTLSTGGSSTFTGTVIASTLAVQGGDTQILNGVDTIAGATTLTKGTLEVGDANSGSTAKLTTTQVNVESGGTLRGHGTIDGNVINDGIVWPGGSVGVLTINGNYTQNSDGALQIDVTPTAASQLLVNGNASLAGTLNLIYAPGTYNSTTYALVQAKAVSGQFASVNATGSVPTALDPKVSYSATQVDLTLAGDATTPPTTTPPATTVKVIAPADGGLYANLMRSVNLVGQQSLTSVLDATLRSTEVACGSANAAHSNTVTSACNSGLWVQYSGSSDSLTGNNGLNSTVFGLQGGAGIMR
ncbi:autotransporter-associated beta strand repeat-containing protein [Dyella terrae]|nr:autotransporter-associated beta strand repeat-containing protein [Dyella terrae]